MGDLAKGILKILVGVAAAGTAVELTRRGAENIKNANTPKNIPQKYNPQGK